MDQKLIAFIILSAALTVTPGIDMALVTRNTLSRGRAAAFATTLGITSGLPIHAFFSAVGLSVILSRSALAFEIVKFLGAAYLIYLGVRTFVTAGKQGGHATKSIDSQASGESSPAEEANPTPEPEGRRILARSYLEGLLNNLLNPKVALFYLTFLPQFISPGDPVIQKSLLLAGIHIALGVAWLSAYAYFVSRLSLLLSRASVKRKLERLTGALLIALGLRLVWERR
jgi:threonine/homoserine/homoserine lactone efflux protein